MALPPRVTIYPTQVASLFRPSIEPNAYSFIQWLGRRHQRMAVAEVPKRTGSLARAHQVHMRLSGPYQVGYTLLVLSRHAIFVHEGTKGPIMSNRPNGLMRVRPAPYSRFGSPTLLRQVRGQRANRWLLETGLRAAASA